MRLRKSIYQNKWPHGVTTGSEGVSRQIQQENGFDCSLSGSFVSLVCCYDSESSLLPTVSIVQQIEHNEYIYAIEISLIFGLDFDSIMNQEDACNSHLCEEAVELRKINESSPKLLNEDFFRSHQLVHCLSSFLDVWTGNGVHFSYLICSTSQYVTSKYIMPFSSLQTGNRYHLRCFILVCGFSVYLV